MAKKSSKKKDKKEKRSGRFLHRETKRSILAIILFTFALLSFLSFFDGAGLWGRYFLKASRFLFGEGFFLVSVFFALAGLAIARPRFVFSRKKKFADRAEKDYQEKKSDKEKPSYRAVAVGISVFILSILGIFHILGAGEEGDFGNLTGGYAGLILGHPLIKYLGFWAGLLVLASLLLISVLVAFNIPFPWNREKEESEEPIIAEDRSREIEKAPEKEKGISFWQRLKGRTSGEASSIAEEKSAQPETDEFVDRAKPEEEKSGFPSGRSFSLAKDTAATAGMAVKSKSGFKLPPFDFLEKDKGHPTSGDIKANINIVKRTLENFGIEVEMAEVSVGPTVTQYTFRPAQGIKLSRITTLQNDLALALAAHPLRIEAPIPGRSLVGIEIPNKSIVMVRLRALLERQAFQEMDSSLAFALGRDVAGNPVFADLCRMPHLLVAGATGTGKTIALNNFIVSLLFRNFPETMKLILIDPKRVELTAYEGIPHLLSPVIVQPDKAVGSLQWAVGEMERRFSVLQELGVRDIGSYNRNMAKAKKSGEEIERLPYIVIIVDELADLMASHGREVEAAIVRLAQMARAVGIHLVVSTQRPSVEVITGLIKANITSRMAFQVASQIDSRTILDMAGAEKLLGNGDMLFLAGNSARPRRVQGAYISEKEVKKVTDYLRSFAEPEYEEEITLASSSSRPTGSFSERVAGEGDAGDDLYEDAKNAVSQAGKASASLLQRRLRIGYARAARLLDILEEKGVVGPGDGAKPREVFIDQGDQGEGEMPSEKNE